MITEKIKYSYNRTFLGRNGCFTASGIELTYFPGASFPFVLLEPITSRGLTGRCFIEVPKENIQELIDILEKMK